METFDFFTVGIKENGSAEGGYAEEMSQEFINSEVMYKDPETMCPAPKVEVMMFFDYNTNKGGLVSRGPSHTY